MLRQIEIKQFQAGFGTHLKIQLQFIPQERVALANYSEPMLYLMLNIQRSQECQSLDERAKRAPFN